MKRRCSALRTAIGDLLHAQEQMDRLFKIGRGSRPTLHYQIRFGQMIQMDEMDRCAAILASVPAANDALMLPAA